MSTVLRPGALLFNAGCTEQVFFLKKIFGADSSYHFREKCKKSTFNSEK